MATFLRCRVSAISVFCQPTTQTPSITNCTGAIVHTKPVNSNFSPKIGCHGNDPYTRSQLCLHRIAWPRKPTPGITQHVASYRTTKVIATKPKLVAMATSLSTAGPPSNTWFLRPIQAPNPKGISIGFAVFAQMTAESPYTLQLDAPSPLKIAPPMGICTPI